MPGTMRSILIVEDEPLIAMMLEDFLETLGHKVVASCDNVAFLPKPFSVQQLAEATRDVLAAK